MVTPIDRSFSIRAAAEDANDAPGLIIDGRAHSFGELANAARRHTSRFGGTAKSSSPRALLATLRLETVHAIYALVERGTPIVPIHPRLTNAERDALCQIAGASSENLVTDPDEDQRGVAIDVPADEEIDPESPLAILFTSGSSGSPKGVVLSRRAFVASAAASAANLPWRPDDRWLLCMPIAHVGGLSIVLRCLQARLPVVVSPWTGSVAQLLADIAEHHVTLLSLVPTMLARILEDGPERPFPEHVRAVLVGGDAARPLLLEEARRRGVPVLTTYGMTETCSQVATLAPADIGLADAGVGRPLPGTDVRIVAGEICVRGPTLFSRYLPIDLFPSLRNGEWFATGDLGEIDASGRLHVTGRRSDLIITGGENVDPREVEAALLSCTGVRAACVFGVADESWGEVVAVAMVLDEGTPRDASAVIEEVRGRLARHKWPRRIAVIGELSVNATGKIDRRATAAAARGALLVV